MLSAKGKFLTAIFALTFLIFSFYVFQNSSNEAIKSDSGRAESSLEKVSLQLKWLHYTGFGVHYIAKEQGLYEMHGLDVDILQGGPGIDPIRLVASGQADFGLASYDQILIARSKGIPVVAIFEDTIKSGVGFMALDSSDIKTPKDLEGKTVATLPGSDKHTIYEALLDKQGVDRSGMTEVPSKFDLSLLFSGQVDAMPAFISNQPIIAAAKGFNVNIIDPVDYGIAPGGNVIFVTEDFLAKNKETIGKFLLAETQAAEKALSIDPATVAAYAVALSPKLDKALEESIWVSTRDMLLNPTASSIGFMKPELWSYTATLFQSAKMLDEDIEIEEAYTNSFVPKQK